MVHRRSTVHPIHPPADLPRFSPRRQGRRSSIITRGRDTRLQTQRSLAKQASAPALDDYSEDKDHKWHLRFQAKTAGKHFALSFGASILVLLTGMILFGYTQSMESMDAIYFTMACMTSISYGDIIPHTLGTRFAVLLAALFGRLLVGYSLSLVSELSSFTVGMAMDKLTQHTGSTDPFVRVRGAGYQTPKRMQTLNPVWENPKTWTIELTNEAHTFEGKYIIFEVWDWDLLTKNDLVGVAAINLEIFEKETTYSDGSTDWKEIVLNIAPSPDEVRHKAGAPAQLFIQLKKNSDVEVLCEVLKATNLPVMDEVHFHETLARDLDHSRELVTVLVIMIGTVGVGGLLFAFMEKWFFFDGLYFCFFSSTFVGYGDFVPTTTFAKGMLVIYAYISAIATGYAISVLQQFTLSRAVKGALRDSEKAVAMETAERSGRNGSLENSLTGRDSVASATDVLPNSTVEMIKDVVLLRRLPLIVRDGILLTLLFLVVLTAGALIFMGLERVPFFDGFYFCFTTMATLGYGDIVPVTSAGRLFALLYMLVGIMAMIYALAASSKNSVDAALSVARGRIVDGDHLPKNHTVHEIENYLVQLGHVRPNEDMVSHDENVVREHTALLASLHRGLEYVKEVIVIVLIVTAATAIGAGILLAAEPDNPGIDGDDGYMLMCYFMLCALLTIGFGHGDVVMTTTAGRILLMVFYSLGFCGFIYLIKSFQRTSERQLNDALFKALSQLHKWHGPPKVIDDVAQKNGLYFDVDDDGSLVSAVKFETGGRGQVMMLRSQRAIEDYQVAMLRWQCKKVARAVSHHSHEKDDDGRSQGSDSVKEQSDSGEGVIGISPSQAGPSPSSPSSPPPKTTLFLGSGDIRANADLSPRTTNSISSSFPEPHAIPLADSAQWCSREFTYSLESQSLIDMQFAPEEGEAEGTRWTGILMDFRANIITPMCRELVFCPSGEIPIGAVYRASYPPHGQAVLSFTSAVEVVYAKMGPNGRVLALKTTNYETVRRSERDHDAFHRGKHHNVYLFIDADDFMRSDFLCFGGLKILQVPRLNMSITSETEHGVRAVFNRLLER